MVASPAAGLPPTAFSSLFLFGLALSVTHCLGYETAKVGSPLREHPSVGSVVQGTGPEALKYIKIWDSFYSVLRPWTRWGCSEIWGGTVFHLVFGSRFQCWESGSPYVVDQRNEVGL